MTELQWNAFKNFRKALKDFCISGLNIFGYNYSQPESGVSAAQRHNGKMLFNGFPLHELQLKHAIKDGVPPYPVETPIVYNHNLENISEKDNIKMILVGDNPGKDEQRHANQRYLVGQSGRVAEGFFKRNPELGIDFRKNVIILNKSVLHTAKTAELKPLLSEDSGSKRLSLFFEESQNFSALQTVNLQQAFNCPLWIVGYGQLKEKGLFAVYAETLKKAYKNIPSEKQNLSLFQHFSMNCFLNDFNKNKNPELSTEENLKAIGKAHRKDILNF